MEFGCDDFTGGSKGIAAGGSRRRTVCEVQVKIIWFRVSRFDLNFLFVRLGNEKYKSKPSPRAKWLEQFDLHLFEEDQLLEVVACSRNINIGKCVIDLKSLPRETTHRLWNKFEDCIGEIYLLLTISGTTASETISDLTTYREDLIDRKSLENKYVNSVATRQFNHGIHPTFSVSGTPSILSKLARCGSPNSESLWRYRSSVCWHWREVGSVLCSWISQQ